MSSEIRKVIREILAPAVVFLPCVALMAAEPAFAAPQSAAQSSSSAQSAPATQNKADPPQNTESSSISTSNGKLKQVVIVAAEKAVATVSPLKFEHVSPGSSVVDVLNNVPGFNSRALGVGGFIVSGTAFTLDGFSSSQVGSTFDGVPDLNTFLGGLYGEGDQPIGQAVVPMDLSGAHVYSGASTQSQSSIDDLGGTIAFQPAMPTKNFHVDVSMNGGGYAGGGSVAQETFAVNSGAFSSFNGLDILAKYQHTLVHGPYDNVVARLNSYYLSAVQPTSSGEVKLVALLNAANGQPPTYVPAPLLAQHGYNYNFPSNVTFTNQATQSSFVALSAKSLLSPRMIGEIKAFYVGTDNDRTAWSNPIYNNQYAGYQYDLNDTLKSCTALNAYEKYAPNPVPTTAYPNVYNCDVATAKFGSAAAGTAYQRYIQNYSEMGAMGHLTLLLHDNTVKVGASGFIAPMLSEEAWYGSWPVPIGTSGYNMAWLEHDGQTWMQAYIEDNIRLMGGKLHIYPGIKWTRLKMFANDDQGYYYDFSGSVTETYKYLEDSLGVNYAFTPQLDAYVNWGQSTKPPNISALYGNIGASQMPVQPTTKPEKVNNIDAGVRFKNARYSWEVAFFNRDFTNIFSSTYSDITGITQTTNAGKALFQGGTIKGEVALPYHLQFEGNVGYTHAVYTESFTNVSGTSFTNGMWRPNIPVVTGHLELRYENGPWYASAIEHYTGSEYVENYETGVTTHYQLGGYGTLNLNGAYTWNINGSTLKSLKFEVHVDNAFNRHSPFYSAGLDTTSTPNFLWMIYNEPLFASLDIKASFF